MKTKKINLNWQSVLLGMALCMVLVFFLGSKANTPQTASQDGSIKSVIESSEMQKQIVAMDKDLTRIEQKIDGLVANMHRVLNIVSVMDREWENNKNK